MVLNCIILNISDHIDTGTYFVFAFPLTYLNGAKCEFVITSFGDARVHVQAPAADLDEADLIAGGTSKRYDLPCASIQVTEGKEPKAIIVTSDVEIKIEAAVIDKSAQPATFLVLPVQEDFTEFVTAGFLNSANVYSATLTVVATESDTQVTFYR